VNNLGKLCDLTILIKMKSQTIHFYLTVVTATLMSAACFSPHSAQAQRLPAMAEAPWGGVFSGYTRRGFHFVINDEAQCEIFLIDKKRNRVGQNRKVRIYPEVVVELADGKRISKRLKNDTGYESDQKPSLKHEKVKLTALTVGEAKVEMMISYSGNKITMDGRVLERGTLKEGSIYFSYKVLMPAMYTGTYAKDKKKEKARMRRDKIKFYRAKDREKVLLKSYVPVNLNDEDHALGGVTEINVSMDGQEGRDFIFTTADGKGVLQFENKVKDKEGKLWKGYQVKWFRAMGDDKASPFVIEVK